MITKERFIRVNIAKATTLEEKRNGRTKTSTPNEKE